ncbi:cystathionine beta-synthase [Brumimicrobium salinarum]|uniref:Cystathionine beta-synthase n=1 Tax=Brumimicrobium salinarum TaxID=2058658 RepID=A0A2I0R5J3_9FLAO|nr:PLP-dependent transferase [Brumimicrobium salinarum]PKR81640.1 cystathionine beta-synthase [Brumimicrobium salinarum]
MKTNKIQDYIKNVIINLPTDWLNLTTHRLDIYNESLAKTAFLDGFEKLYLENNAEQNELSALPTAYDYIRLGHPLSSILEWSIAKMNDLNPEAVISFSSKTAPILAVLRKNLLDNKATRILYFDKLPECFDEEVIKRVYGYKFKTQKIENIQAVESVEETTILIDTKEDISAERNLYTSIDFFVEIYNGLGSIILTNGLDNNKYINEIQHVRRRETISMTPQNSYRALQELTSTSYEKEDKNTTKKEKETVQSLIQQISGSETKALAASSGLSMQYAIMMGLIEDALENHPNKEIKFIVPPNCYGGTNDQARRVAACLDNVEIVDLPVDGDNDMVQSINKVLNTLGEIDAIPYIIAEIPTNPRVEVPNLDDLKAVLTAKRTTKSGEQAIDPVFILDQTFCPNVHFLGEGEILSEVRTISYASGSKFPSGGKCTAGYCIGNTKTNRLIDKVEKHLLICDNEATALQYEILAEQMPSMNQRIESAYKNTKAFVEFIKNELPPAKVNFVSDELAKDGFTPSVFSLDLPTFGDTPEEREENKRKLNLKLINMMITEIPEESKYCVSYGQLKGCYWTIPATSTQGTTKEGDKDYIVRASLSGQMDLDRHKAVFKAFVNSLDQ